MARTLRRRAGARQQNFTPRAGFPQGLALTRHRKCRISEAMSGLKIFDLPNHTFRLDGGAMFGVVPKALWEKEYPADEANRILMTTRMILIQHPESGRNLVVDPGIGDVWDEKFTARYAIEEPAQTLDESLAELGLTRDHITDVVLTHLHFDHLAGCLVRAAEGFHLKFPQARHHVQAAHWDYARDPSAKDLGSFTEEHLAILAGSGMLNRIEEQEHQLLPGLQLFRVDGHTPAQQLLRLTTPERTWVYGGDLFPMEAFLRAPWIMAYDLEPLKTLEAKTRVLQRHLSAGEWLILAHDPHTLGGGPLDYRTRYPQLAQHRAASDTVTPL
jgi:glyoxylase-like metal-dependent hydrolase (beta-lactamase superfamily II)